jgi:heat shock protein HspQ
MTRDPTKFEFGQSCHHSLTGTLAILFEICELY